jgi:hypothetical protein
MDWISFAGTKRLETTADISSKEKTDKKKDLKAHRHSHTHTHKSARHNMDIYIF